MKKLVRILVVACIVVCAISTVALGQSATDIIRNIKIVSIKSVGICNVIDLKCEENDEKCCRGIDDKHLIVVVEFQNDNDLEIKLTENVEFNFYIQDRELDQRLLVKHTYIGKDIKHEGKREPIQFGKKGTPESLKNVVFKVVMEEPTLQTVIHMLNFIGIPPSGGKTKDMFIKAKFDLGFKSDRGWSYAEKLRVEWMFCPEQQDRLPLKECFHEPVELPVEQK